MCVSGSLGEHQEHFEELLIPTDASSIEEAELEDSGEDLQELLRVRGQRNHQIELNPVYMSLVPCGGVLWEYGVPAPSLRVIQSVYNQKVQSRYGECRYGDLRLFADDVALLVSSDCDLQ